ncbi:HTH La-type RNA-binding domain-containing protein [Pseudozyma hubeiensis]|nr:HTH La-type RNA-binding domain-containing protein [Pseudozyma hubeiensis]
MSAWSSSTGKAQLSYADRLRQASKSNPTPKQEPAPTPSGFATRAVQHNATKAAPTSASTSLSATAPQSRRLSSASSTGAAPASGSAARAAAGPSEFKGGNTAEDASSTSQASSSPAVNVWEARRKQLADREAEKERERRAAPTPQKQAATPVTATPNAGGASHKSRQSPAGPKKANERHSKGSSTSSQSDRKAVKSGNQASGRAPNSASISSTSTRATTNASTVPVSDGPSTSSPKPKLAATKTDAAEAQSAEGTQSANKEAEHSASAQAAQVSGSSSKVHKTQTGAKVTGSDAQKGRSTQNQDVGTSSRSQSAAAQMSPSDVPSVQTVSAPTATSDDVPGSPATVASAIEEVLKNGGAHGAQTEDDDAWLARIHLLNGGQNMPNFGGFGANGGPALNEEAEMQAAKKAERAVAAAWGAGKSVWNKSHHNNQQPSAPSDSKATSVASSARAEVKDKAHGSAHDDSDVKEKDPDILATEVSASNGIVSESSDLRGQETRKGTISGEKTETNDTNTSSSKRVTSPKPEAPAQPQKSGKRAAKTKVASLPSFEDVNNWPSPLDAGRKPADKPKAAAASAGDADKSDRNKAGQPQTPKSLYETLDELQVRLAPGVNPQPSGSVAGARKGKQQWVPILPEITHTSAPASGGKPNRPASDARTAKAGQKQQQSQQQQQQRKDGNRSGQTQQSAQSGKKDGGQKQKAARAEGKALARDGTADAAAGAKAGESQSGSGKAGGKSNAASHGQAASVQQPGEAEQTRAVTSDESASAGAEPQPTTSSTTSPSASDSSSKQPQPQPQSQQSTRINVRPQPNGNSTSSLQPHPNGVRPSKSPTSSGVGTPATNRSSPRGSVVSSPKAHPLPRPAPQPTQDLSPSFAAPTPPMYYGPSGVATPMLSSSQPAPYPSWMPYNAYTRPFLFDSTTQTGASLPPGVLGQLLGQIEFYFSQRNLEGDFFLRQKMDEEGWVDIGVVAGFKRVKGIVGEGDEGGMVRDALGWSKVLDVDAGRGRVRRRYGWELYTMKGVAATDDAADARGKDEDEDDEALGVVSASGFGGKLEV